MQNCPFTIADTTKFLDCVETQTSVCVSIRTVLHRKIYYAKVSGQFCIDILLRILLCFAKVHGPFCMIGPKRILHRQCIVMFKWWRIIKNWFFTLWNDKIILWCWSFSRLKTTLSCFVFFILSSLFFILSSLVLLLRGKRPFLPNNAEAENRSFASLGFDTSNERVDSSIVKSSSLRSSWLRSSYLSCSAHDFHFLAVYFYQCIESFLYTALYLVADLLLGVVASIHCWAFSAYNCKSCTGCCCKTSLPEFYRGNLLQPEVLGSFLLLLQNWNLPLLPLQGGFWISYKHLDSR